MGLFSSLFSAVSSTTKKTARVRDYSRGRTFSPFQKSKSSFSNRSLRGGPKKR